MAAPVKDTDRASWDKFISLCTKIGAESGRLLKTEIVKEFVSNYGGDLKIFLKLILPKESHRVYQMHRKRIKKLFASILSESEESIDDLMTTGEFAGYLGKAISHSYKNCGGNFPQRNKASSITMKQIDEFLDKLTKETTESAQEKILRSVTMKCTPQDLMWFIRELDHDLKINAGKKAVLDGVHPKAYDAYQLKTSLDYLVQKISLGASLTIGSDVMMPFKPMLAAPCKDYDAPFTKWKTNVVWAEIKYDGERVQVHFDGKEWKYYARSLKPVAENKIKNVKDDVQLSCPKAQSFILDAEVLMVDTTTGKPLPFGSLGKHKRAEFKNASPCLFVFDILYFNGNNLLKTPLKERRKILESQFQRIPNKVHLSELKVIEGKQQLMEMMEEMVNDNQEGLMIKDPNGIYGPNKRHWYKMKKDYLDDGQLADSADLIVLGAYKGHGKHGGYYSTYLMGTLDRKNNRFLTVCKAHNGLTDDQIKEFTESIKMVPFTDCPQWLSVSNNLRPDWVVPNPKKSPIFEISGFEFTESESHTATDHEGKGISIRFPRITRIRDDKKYKDATNLEELRHLVKVSRESPGDALKTSNGKKKKKKKENDSKKETKKRGMKRKQMTIMDALQPPMKKQKVDSNHNLNRCNDENDDKEDEDEDQEMKSLQLNGNKENGSCDGDKVKLDPPTESDDDDDVDMKNGRNSNKLKVNVMDGIGCDGISPPPFDAPASPKPDHRTVCRYDDHCMRKNPIHFEEYQHPKQEAQDMMELKTERVEAMKVFEKRKEEKCTAARILKENKIEAAEQEFKEMMAKFQSEFDRKIEEIKQKQQFEIEKIKKKYHPKDD